MVFYTTDADASQSEILRLTGSDSFVGIGTGATVGAKLHVNSGSAYLVSEFYSTHSTENDIRIGGSASANDSLVIGFNQTADYGFIMVNGEAVGAGLVIADGGNIGMGKTPASTTHLAVEKLDIVGSGSGYMGIYSNHQVDSSSASDGSYYGMYSVMDINHSGTDADNTVGGFFQGSITNSDNGSVNLIGVSSKSVIAAGDVDNMYSLYALTDYNGGQVDDSVYGGRFHVHTQTGGSIAGYVIGIAVVVDADTNPSGQVHALNLNMETNGTYFIVCYDDANDVNRFLVDDEGVVSADGAITANAWDYAEYFESKDGNPIAIGVSVKLDGDKIVPASEGDTLLGVIRPPNTSTVVGNCAWNDWDKKYMKDDYGADVMEDYTLTKWVIEVDHDEYVKRGKTEKEQKQYSKVEGSEAKDAIYYSSSETIPEGKEVGDVKVPAVDAVADTYFREHKYHSDRIPDGLTAPDDAEVIEVGNQRNKLNPDYDPTKEYKSREERDEWHIVGLLGQIPITKGQPTGNWIKMKDVSDTVEMYFVK